MALSHARSITIDGVVYQWKFLGSKENLIGWASRVGRIVVCNAKTSASFITGYLLSKRWNPAYNGNEDSAPLHKASLTSKDVETTIRTAIAAGWDPLRKGRFEVAATDLTDYGPC